MDIKITQPVLNQALQLLAPATSANPTVPTSKLARITIQEGENNSFVEAHNGEIYIKKPIHVLEITEPGSALVDHAKLYTWIAKTPEDKVININNATKDNINQLRCKAGRSVITLALGDIGAFPSTEFYAGKTITLPSDYLKTGLNTTSTSRIGLPEKADLEGRISPLIGTHLHITSTHIRVEALSHAYGAFYKRSLEIKGLVGSLDIILPIKTIAIFQRVLPDTGNIRLVMNSTNSMLELRLSDAIYRTVLLAAQFPNTDRFYEAAEEDIIYDIEINPDEFYHSLQSALAFVEARKSDHILMWSDPGEDNALELAMESQENEEGSFSTVISNVTITEDHPEETPFHIAANIDQMARLSATLRANTAVRMIIKGKNTTPAMYLYGLDSHPNTFYITMPVRVEDALWKQKQASYADEEIEEEDNE